MAEARLVAEAFLDQLPHRIHFGRLDREDGAAGVAHEVLALPGVGRRVETRAVAEMAVTHQSDLLQGLEVAIDRGQIRAGQTSREAVGDLLSRDRRVGRVQRLEHEAPGRGDPQALRAQYVHRGLDVVRCERRT